MCLSTCVRIFLSILKQYSHADMYIEVVFDHCNCWSSCFLVNVSDGGQKSAVICNLQL